jgi:GT2 family glycosyltransferase
VTSPFDPSSRVTVVVVAHNAAARLDPCLESIVASGRVAELIVVDSGSADGGVAPIARRYGATHVLLGSNRGPCAARNLGAGLAKTPFVLFVDDDMFLEPSLVGSLETALRETPNGAMAGPVIVFDDRRDAIQYAGGAIHFGGLPHLLRLGERPVRTRPPEKVDVLTAGCLMVDREAFLSAGGFDEEFFYLAEDVDLSMRLRQRGKYLVLIHHAIARNIGGTLGVSLKDGAYPARRMELHSRNRWLLVAKRYDRWTVFALLPALVFYEAAWFLFALAAGRLRPYLRGKRRAAPIVLRELFRKRRREPKVVSDRALLAAPPLTLTPTALAQPFARRFARILDGTLRIFFLATRGALR